MHTRRRGFVHSLQSHNHDSSRTALLWRDERFYSGLMRWAAFESDVSVGGELCQSKYAGFYDAYVELHPRKMAGWKRAPRMAQIINMQPAVVVHMCTENVLCILYMTTYTIS